MFSFDRVFLFIGTLYLIFYHYFLSSTHFWGPVANWGIPLAAIADTNKDVSLISGKMTFGKFNCHTISILLFHKFVSAF